MDWGADRKVLLKLYTCRSLFRTKLDYGCIVYGSARLSYLRKMDSLHNQGLRLALDTFRTSPVNSLYAEANEPSLNLRRKKLSWKYYFRLKSKVDVKRASWDKTSYILSSIHIYTFFYMLTPQPYITLTHICLESCFQDSIICLHLFPLISENY